MAPLPLPAPVCVARHRDVLAQQQHGRQGGDCQSVSSESGEPVGPGGPLSFSGSPGPGSGADARGL